jgi:hypothetical protein
LLGRFLYTSSPPELPAGPDTMLASSNESCACVWCLWRRM